MDYFFAPERYETPDFVIRSYHAGDGLILQEAVNTSYEHLRTFMPWAKPYSSVDEEEALVRRFYAQYLTNENFTLGIFSLDGKRLLGGTGFHLNGLGVEHKTAEVGMWVVASEAGKGLGTLALKAMLHWGFTDWPWQRVIWRCDTLNLASASVARKAGMQLEATLRQEIVRADGTRRDTYQFCLLRDEYAESPSS